MDSGLFIVGFVCLCGPVAFGQSTLNDTVLAGRDPFLTEHSNDLIPGSDALFDDLYDENSGSAELERLADLREDPFDLNTVAQAELETIPGITSFEAEAIVKFRKLIRKFASIRQLAVIEGIDESILTRAQPYLVVRKKGVGMGGVTRPSVRFTSRLTRSLQPRKGFLDGTFCGPPIKSLHRIVLRGWDDVECSLLYAKDEGERYSDGFLSGSVSIENWLGGGRLILGDFVVEAAQGLVLWRQSSYGKSAAISLAKKSGLGARPYCSSGEFGSFRGLTYANRLHIGGCDLQWEAFLSFRSLSASTDGSGAVLGFAEEGLFRTQHEIAKRNAVHERVVGGRAQLSLDQSWKFGATFLHTSYDRDLLSSMTGGISGAVNQVEGFDATLTSGNLSIFGEIAFPRNGAGAGIVGAMYGTGSQCGLAVIYRNYSAGFQNSHAHGFGERGNTSNERGMFFTVRVPVSQFLHLSAYVDHYKFPWRTALNAVPARGCEIRAEAKVESPHGFDIAVTYRNETKESTESARVDPGLETQKVVDRLQESLRLTVVQKMYRAVTITGRVEITRLHYSLIGGGERGSLFYQAMRYSVGGFAAEARLIFFDTESYDSRLYEYETDLQGVFANPALSGIGHRWYLVISFAPCDVVKISSKYVETRYDGVRSIGTGPMEISGDLDNRLAVQVDIKL